MKTRGRNVGRRATLGSLALILQTGCGLPGHAPRRLAPEDVTSVGYGTQSREDIAVSISSVSPDSIGDGNFSRIQHLLEDVPGLQVTPFSNGDFTVRIRGIGVDVDSAEPLLVIDDAPVPAGWLSSTLAGIHPREIVRIDVLKDVASTAIYGARGTNGVIIVTTRRLRQP